MWTFCISTETFVNGHVTIVQLVCQQCVVIINNTNVRVDHKLLAMFARPLTNRSTYECARGWYEWYASIINMLGSDYTCACAISLPTSTQLNDCGVIERLCIVLCAPFSGATFEHIARTEQVVSSWSWPDVSKRGATTVNANLLWQSRLMESCLLECIRISSSLANIRWRIFWAIRRRWQTHVKRTCPCSPRARQQVPDETIVMYGIMRSCIINAMQGFTSQAWTYRL